MRLLSVDEKQKYYGQFFQMLSESDDDFVPTLSARTTTRQENLSDCEKNADGIKSYLDSGNDASYVVSRQYILSPQLTVVYNIEVK